MINLTAMSHDLKLEKAKLRKKTRAGRAFFEMKFTEKKQMKNY